MKKESPSNTWYNLTCRNKKIIFNRARKKFQNFNSTENKETVKAAGKDYKNAVLRAHRTYSDEIRANVRNLRRQNNKRSFWKYCKNKSTNFKNAKIDFKEFTNFFKELNKSNNNVVDNSFLDQTDPVPNIHLDADITESEIRNCILKLKNGKACGDDYIKNEYIKATIDTMLPTYLLLFNYVFKHGIVPESWTTGIIKPIFKNKGSVNDPNNYRPLSILSCMGKYFSCLLNSRLQKYLENENILGEEQIGFRSGYSTTDGIFILNSLQSLLRNQNKNLLCAFIDLKKCFGSIWREGLWSKLNNLNLGVKMIGVFKSMYNNIKSKLTLSSLDENETLIFNESSYFSCENGLREGEILSPIMFSLYVNDLKHFLEANQCQGTTAASNFNGEILIYAKLLLVMYADDVVIFAHTKRELQKSLDVYYRYCERWRLEINISKTKILCFGRKRKVRFFINKQQIDIVDDFKYLGITFSKNGRLITAIKENIKSATKALHALRGSFRDKHIPIDCQLELIDSMIEPILLYGAEIWGYENISLLENFQLSCLKNVLKVRQNTPNYMVFGETGKIPISVKIKTRMIKYWKHLVTGKSDKISFQIYRAMINEYVTNDSSSFKWLKAIKDILIETGNYQVWLEQYISDSKAKDIEQVLKDQAFQHLDASMSTSNKGSNYKNLKSQWGVLPNIYNCNQVNLFALIKYRTSNHKLPVEVGRYNGTPFNERSCPFCENSLGDEYHYMLECKRLKSHRNLYIDKNITKRPNMAKYLQLMSSNEFETLNKIGKFSACIMKIFRS